MSEEELAKAQRQRPDHPRFAVYMDESGKTGKHLLVGSLWFNHPPEFLSFVKEFYVFKENHGFAHKEFHFKEINNNNLIVYMRFSEWLARKMSIISFKSLSVENAGLSRTAQALEDLFYHLIVRGVRHEHVTGRAPLPRSIQIWKDKEEVGKDKLSLENLADKLRGASNTQFSGDLDVGDLEAVDSKEHPLLQVTDLYIGSLNRRLNTDGNKEHAKDKLAAHFLQLIGLPDGPQEADSIGDLVVHMSL